MTEDLANISETKLVLDGLKEKRKQIDLEIKQLEIHYKKMQ